MKHVLMLLIFVTAARAQAPANSVLIGTEGITITACSTTNCTFMFGANGKFNTVANPKYPLTVSCSSASACNSLGGDPAPGVVKSIYAVQQAASFTVSSKNSAGAVQPPIPIPPLKVPVKVYSCTSATGIILTVYSDGSQGVSGAYTCKEIL